MGGVEREWKQYRRHVDKGDVRAAMRTAKAYELILDLGDTLNLVLLAAKVRDPIFDRMAVRWIRRVDDKAKRPLALGEVRWLAQRFEAVQRGDSRAAGEIERFLARGRR
jgi:hypothetical protein